VEINQSYKAPSIPKISRRNIKSSVFSGATTSQLILKKSSFSFVKSFIKPKVSPISSTELQAPETESKESPSIFGLGKVLEQTNTVLVDIKKQLSLDFLNRIFNEKKFLENEKKKIAAKKVADKEARIEKGGKGILGKSLEKVTAPFRSIFDKLIDFFSIILTGILVNNAFNWLSDKNNQKKLTEFFNFIKDYWQELLIIFAAYKLAKLVGVIFGIGLKIKKILQWVNKFKTSQTSPKGSPISGTPILPSKPLSRLNQSYAKFISGKSNIIDRLRLIKRGFIKPSQIFSKGGVEALRGTVNAPKASPTPRAGVVGGGPSGLLLNLVAGEAIGRATGFVGQKFEDYSLKQSVEKINKLPKDKREEVVGKIKKKLKEEKEWMSGFGGVYNALVGAGGLLGETIDQRSIRKKENLLNALGEKFSNGGTIGKGDRPGTDMVPAMTTGGKRVRLDEGEEVSKASEAMRWRPLLKDVNDNGAKMWQAFTRAIKKQEEVNTVETGNTDTFSKLLEEYEKMLKDEERRLRQKYIKSIGGTTSPTQPPTPTPPSPTPAASPTPSSTPGTSPATPAAPSTPAVMPNASQPGAPGIPGDPGAPKIGEPVGASSQPSNNKETVATSVQPSTPESIKPLQTSTAAAQSLPITQTSAPINPSSPETDASQKLTSLPFKVDTSFNYKNYFSNFSKLQPNNLQKVFEDKNSLLSPSSSSVNVINMPLPPITVDNSKPGSIPAPSGNPTPLPNISSINPLYEEEIALTAVTLGILV